jgi:mono/diheme cytochrome c family protein
MKPVLITSLLLVVFLGAACAQPAVQQPAGALLETPTAETQASPMMEPMGGGMGMMQRHHASVPAEYASLSSPVVADEESLARGGEIYTIHCASCHGDGGLGDGPAGTLLEPPASPVAHTSQMMGDGYLFWRISEGGVPFKTGMPTWKDTLDEQARWDVINYVRALGSGQVHPGSALDPTAEAARHAEMLSQAIQQGVISEPEAQVFEQVHDLLQERLRANPDLPGSNMDERQAAALAELVVAGTLTQEQADQFLEIHDRLVASGLMQ